MFSCEFCEIFKKTFFREHLPATASYLQQKQFGESEATIGKLAAKIFFQIHRGTPVPKSYFLLINMSKAFNTIKKETLTQMFCDVIFEILQESYF